MAEVVDDTFTCTLVVYVPLAIADIIEVKVNGVAVPDGGTIDVPTDTVKIEVRVTNTGYSGIIWVKLYENGVEIASDSATIPSGGIEVFEFTISYTTAGGREIKIEAGHTE